MRVLLFAILLLVSGVLCAETTVAGYRSSASPFAVKVEVDEWIDPKLQLPGVSFTITNNADKAVNLFHISGTILRPDNTIKGGFMFVAKVHAGPGEEVFYSKTNREWMKLADPDDTVLLRVKMAEFEDGTRWESGPEADAMFKKDVGVPKKVIPETDATESAEFLKEARSAEESKRLLDALIFYQYAFQAGAKDDDIKSKIAALLNQLGGTESAWLAMTEFRQGWQPSITKVPPFTAKDLTEKSWTSENLRGRTTLVNVWATWCAPCRRELPHVQKLYDQIRGRNDIQVITWNMDDDPKDAREFMAAKGFTFPAVMQSKELKSMYDVVAEGLPANFIIDPTAYIVLKSFGYNDTDSVSWVDSMKQSLESISAIHARMK